MVKNKPVVTKGVQNFLLRNVNHISPRAYIHRHNLQMNSPGWMVMGNIEVENLMEDLNPMIQGEGIDIKIFKDNPKFTFDNYLSGENVTNWLGRKDLVVPSLT